MLEILLSASLKEDNRLLIPITRVSSTFFEPTSDTLQSACAPILSNHWPLPKPVQTWWISIGIYAFSLATPCRAAVSWQAKSSGLSAVYQVWNLLKKKTCVAGCMFACSTDRISSERGQNSNRQCRRNPRSVQTDIRCPRICRFSTILLPFFNS